MIENVSLNSVKGKRRGKMFSFLYVKSPCNVVYHSIEFKESTATFLRKMRKEIFVRACTDLWHAGGPCVYLAAASLE